MGLPEQASISVAIAGRDDAADYFFFVLSG
jgi:hypothetical protein